MAGFIFRNADIQSKCTIVNFLLEIPLKSYLRTRIEGGETVKENVWGEAYTMPWQVGITEKNGREIKSGATIICPKFVIGCAHGKKMDTLKLEVIWGSRTMVISEDAIRRDVKKKHTHRKFNDSSLVRFACEKHSG